MNQIQKKYVILGSLCALVLMLVVGYAAFNTVLKIIGTSNISSNWDIKITNITSNILHGTPSNAKDPEGIGTLTATFETNLVSPGDSMEYDITITNNGTLNATLDKIKVSDLDNEYITFETSGLTEGSTLSPKGTAVLKVVVTYKDIAEGQGQPTNTKGTLTVTLDYVQEGSSGGSTGESTNNFTGTIYSYNVLPNEGWSTNSIWSEDSIEKIKGYTEDYNTLGSNFFLKHSMVNGQVKLNEVCFIKDGLHCLKNNEYELSKTTLLSVFGESACYVNDSYITCSDGLLNTNANYEGIVDAYDSSIVCHVLVDGSAACYAR